MNQLELGDELAAAAGGLLAAWDKAELQGELAERYWRTVRAVKSWQSAREGAVAECTECGQDVPIQFGVTREASASTLRALLGQVAAGGLSVEDAARLVETWPTPGGAS